MKKITKHEPVAPRKTLDVESPQPATSNLQLATIPLPQSAEPKTLDSPSPTLDSRPETPDSPAKRRRTGNVGRLSKQLRQQVNEMLDDGVPYLEIIEILGEHGKDLNEDIIYRWKKGGYQDYLREQRFLQQCRQRRDHAFGLLASNNHINGFQATQQIASAQICEVVADLGSDILREALVANPLNYFRMLNSFSRLTSGGLRCERHLADEAERQDRLESAQSTPEKGISPKAVKQMEEAIHLM